LSNFLKSMLWLTRSKLYEVHKNCANRAIRI